MKKKSFLKGYIDIADIHAIHLKESLQEVARLMPLTADKLSNLQPHQVAFMDMMTMRFSKLQDTIGAKIFSLILEILGEDALSFIDKLNKLEKIGYLTDVNWWMDLREIRNAITHDYPNDYIIIATHMTVLLNKVEELLNFWDHLKSKISNLLEPS